MGGGVLQRFLQEGENPLNNRYDGDKAAQGAHDLPPLTQGSATAVLWEGIQGGEKFFLSVLGK